MKPIRYTVEGLSFRQFRRNEMTITGYKVYLAYPCGDITLHCDSWISSRSYDEKPFTFGDILNISFDCKGKIMDYDIQERSKVE